MVKAVGVAALAAVLSVAVALWKDYAVARSLAYGLMLVGALVVFVAPAGPPTQRLDSFRARDMEHFRHARSSRAPTGVPQGFVLGTLLAGLGVLVFFASA